MRKGGVNIWRQIVDQYKDWVTIFAADLPSIAIAERNRKKYFLKVMTFKELCIDLNILCFYLILHVILRISTFSYKERERDMFIEFFNKKFVKNLT